MRVDKICNRCGSHFIGHSSVSRFCPECVIIRNRDNARERARRLKKIRATESPQPVEKVERRTVTQYHPKKKKPLSVLALEAKRLGVSYGVYRAMLDGQI